MARRPPCAGLFIFAVLLLGLPPGLRGQESAPDDFGGGFLVAGAQRLKLDALNRRMVAAGHAAFSPTVLSVGGGGHTTLSRVLLGGEGHVLLGRREGAAGSAFRTRLTGGYGLVSLGHIVAVHRSTIVYPVLGVGVSGLRVDFEETGDQQFEDILHSPARNAALNHAAFLLDASIGANHMKAVRGPGERGVTLGVRVGYTASPFSGAWRHPGGTVNGGPDLGVRGVYVRLILGGWAAARRGLGQP